MTELTPLHTKTIAYLNKLVEDTAAKGEDVTLLRQGVDAIIEVLSHPERQNFDVTLEDLESLMAYKIPREPLEEPEVGDVWLQVFQQITSVERKETRISSRRLVVIRVMYSKGHEPMVTLASEGYDTRKDYFTPHQAMPLSFFKDMKKSSYYAMTYLGMDHRLVSHAKKSCDDYRRELNSTALREKP